LLTGAKQFTRRYTRRVVTIWFDCGQGHEDFIKYLAGKLFISTIRESCREALAQKQAPAKRDERRLLPEVYSVACLLITLSACQKVPQAAKAGAIT